MSLCRRPIRRIALATKTGSFINKAIFKSSSQQSIYSQLEQTYINAEQPKFQYDEQQGDAIFKVYLKRIHHKSSSTTALSTDVDTKSEQNETTGDIQNSEHGTLLYSTIKVYQLKAGTLEIIVEHLTNDEGELDKTHMNILFSTYRKYTTTQILIETIINRYRHVLPASLDMTENVRQKSIESIRTALICFLNEYKDDFNDPPDYSTLNYLIKNVPDLDIQKRGKTLLEKLKRDDENSKSNVDDNNNNTSTLNTSTYGNIGFDYIAPWNLLEMPSSLVAEQLTIVDADLLKRVLPYDLLVGSTVNCSRRTAKMNMNRSISTVDKTIEYFNAVVARVIATILKEQDERARANIIEKWIDIAFNCRKLKNFSSLTAILHGLLSGCIYRLETAWSYVQEASKKTFKELKDTFTNCDHKKKAREVLDKQLENVRHAFRELPEATAKYPDLTAYGATLSKKSRQKDEIKKSKMTGTVPYLGMYLSDLTYNDSAHKDTIDISEKSNSEKKLINFEKYRKQYEILVQVKLCQSAAGLYDAIHPIPRFRLWFDNVRIYNDSESWELSYQIQPTENRDQTQPSLFQRIPSQLSIESTILASNSDKTNSAISTLTVDRSLPPSPSLISLDKMSMVSSDSSQPFNMTQSISKSRNTSNKNHSRSSSGSSFITSSNGSSALSYMPMTSSGSNNPSSDETESIIAKVHMAGNHGLYYKTVRIRNNERTTSVLKGILEKFGLDSSTYDRYCIEQKLTDRKIAIRDHSNVFYALAPSADNGQIELTVREKTRQEREQQSNCSTPTSGHKRTPSGFNSLSSQSR